MTQIGSKGGSRAVRARPGARAATRSGTRSGTRSRAVRPGAAGAAAERVIGAQRQGINANISGIRDLRKAGGHLHFGGALVLIGAVICAIIACKTHLSLKTALAIVSAGVVLGGGFIASGCKKYKEASGHQAKLINDYPQYTEAAARAARAAARAARAARAAPAGQLAPKERKRLLNGVRVACQKYERNIPKMFSFAGLETREDIERYTNGIQNFGSNCNGGGVSIAQKQTIAESTIEYCRTRYKEIEKTRESLNSPSKTLDERCEKALEIFQGPEKYSYFGHFERSKGVDTSNDEGKRKVIDIALDQLQQQNSCVLKTRENAKTRLENASAELHNSAGAQTSYVDVDVDGEGDSVGSPLRIERRQRVSFAEGGVLTLEKGVCSLADGREFTFNGLMNNEGGFQLKTIAFNGHSHKVLGTETNCKEAATAIKLIINGDSLDAKKDKTLQKFLDANFLTTSESDTATNLSSDGSDSLGLTESDSGDDGYGPLDPSQNGGIKRKFSSRSDGGEDQQTLRVGASGNN